jgi:hypothetical protein
VATGIGNVLGNKGGVGVGLTVGGNTRILFLNSHFAAHDEKVDLTRWPNPPTSSRIYKFLNYFNIFFNFAIFKGVNKV